MAIIKSVIVLMILLVPMISSVEAIEGTVIDSETERPVEGAYIFARWTIEKGLPGLSNTENYKIAETITDKKGNFKLFGVLNPFVDQPSLVVYKKGYTAWNNHYIFPNWEKRKDWVSGSIIRLEKFRPDYIHYGHQYTHYGHMDFLNSPYLLGQEGVEIVKASEWEREIARKEVYKKIHVQLVWTVIDEETEEPIENAVGVIIGTGYGYPIKGQVVEIMSNNKGKVNIDGEFQLLARPPNVIIYKKGYVAWHSNVIFPSHSQRKDFKWQTDYIVRLKKWHPNYNHMEHFSFVGGHVFRETKLGKAVAWEEHHGNLK